MGAEPHPLDDLPRAPDLAEGMAGLFT